jgi:hypothetical protein
VTGAFTLRWGRSIKLLCGSVRSSVPILLLLFILLGGLGCESNPLGGNEISGGRASVGGLVRLGNNPSADGVFVWLDGFDLSTRTDSIGRFEIVLPPPAVQSANGGITGVFNLYFYMANFRLDSAAVLVRNGEFVYSEGDINSEGELITPMNLVQLLRLRSVMLPETVVKGEPAIISSRIFLETTQTRDTVTVVYPRNVNGLFNPVIFDKVGANEILILGSTNVGVLEGDTLRITRRDPEEIILIIGASPTDLTIGRYHAIPFLFVLQPTVPAGLLKNLGADAQLLGPDYLAMPFLRELKPLTVLERVSDDD